jgi:O-antigen/teichoic acid export membrane protein
MADAAARTMPSTGVQETAERRLPTTLLQSIAIRFAVSGVNALTGIITARALHPTGRGELAALVLWPVLLAGMTTLGVPNALIYHVRSDPSRTAGLVWCALLISLATGALATVLGWYVVPLWLGQQHPDITTAAQYCLLATVVSSVTLMGRAAWEAKGQFGRSNLSQLVVPLAILIALIPQVRLGTLTPTTAAATYLLAGVPVVIWMLVSVSRAYGPILRGTSGLWGRLLHYGSRCYGVDLSGWLALYLDQALVVGLLRPDAMGIYVVALSLSRVLYAVHGSLAMMVFPKVVGLEIGELVEAIARSARLGAMAAGGMGLAVIGVGPILLHWLYGPAYDPAGPLLPIFVGEVVCAGIAHVLLQGLLAAGRPGVATLVQISGVALSIPLFLLLVPAFGVVGAALALLASTTLRVVLAMVSYPPFVHAPIPRVWIGPGDLADLAAYRGALIQAVTRLRAGAAK